MLRGAITLFRTMTASLLMLAALVVFGTPSIAHAHGTPHAISAEPEATHVAAPLAPDAPAALTLAGPAMEVVVTSTAPVPSPTDDDGCGRHGGPGNALGCCVGAACAAMHGGLAPVEPLPLPAPEASAILMPADQAAKGISTLPAIKPPRAAV
jgi:hypothetical protein